MKIAMVSDLTPGGDRYDVASFVSALARRTHEVRIFSATADAAAVPAGVTVERIPVSAPEVDDPDGLMPMVEEMGRYLVDAWTAEMPDVVHCHGWTYGMAAQLAANRHPVPTAQSFHELSSTVRHARGGTDTMSTTTKLETLLARNATTVTVACTDDLRQLIRQGIPRAKLSVLSSGVDVDDIAVDDIVSRGDRSPHRLVAVARDFSPSQGLAHVLRVLLSLPSAELVLVATDDDAADDSRPLLELARSLRVAHRVRTVVGADGEQLSELFRSADVVICPSSYEPSCATVLRAMACGVPVVAAAVGGVRDAVVAEVTGLLVPPGNVAALARALRATLGQIVLRQGMGLAGRSRARSRYSWDRIATDAEVVYTAAAARHRAPAQTPRSETPCVAVR